MCPIYKYVWGKSYVYGASYIVTFSYGSVAICMMHARRAIRARACMYGRWPVYMPSIWVYIYTYGVTLCIEASQRYPNTIQQAIVNIYAYMGCSYAYGIGILPIHVYGTTRTRMGQYSYAYRAEIYS